MNQSGCVFNKTLFTKTNGRQDVARVGGSLQTRRRRSHAECSPLLGTSPAPTALFHPSLPWEPLMGPFSYQQGSLPSKLQLIANAAIAVGADYGASQCPLWPLSPLGLALGQQMLSG